VRRIVVVASILLVLALAGLGTLGLYLASQRVPTFYSAAIAVEPARQQKACREFVAEATALASDLSQPGRWQRLFTAEQVNAWLAIELAANYPELLPQELSDPRVCMSEGEVVVGLRYRSGDLETILSLSFDAYLQEPNVIAIHVRGAHAGALPVPLGQVLDSISHAARQLNLQLEWRTSQGDPVALVTVPQSRDGGHAPFSVEQIELRKGELFLAGTVGTERYDASPILPEPLDVPTAQADSPTEPRVGSAAKETRQE
jgi:hypothetical protein